MRIHVDDQPVAQFVVVTLDGKPLEHVVWADDVDGVAEVEVFDEDGPIKEEGRTLVERLEGEVSIALVDDVPAWVASLYEQLKIDQVAKAALEYEQLKAARAAAGREGSQGDSNGGQPGEEPAG